MCCVVMPNNKAHNKHLSTVCWHCATTMINCWAVLFATINYFNKLLIKYFFFFFFFFFCNFIISFALQQQAFEHFINSSPKSPEYISLYIDEKLRKGLKVYTKFIVNNIVIIKTLMCVCGVGCDRCRGGDSVGTHNGVVSSRARERRVWKVLQTTFGTTFATFGVYIADIIINDPLGQCQSRFNLLILCVFSDRCRTMRSDKCCQSWNASAAFNSHRNSKACSPTFVCRRKPTSGTRNTWKPCVNHK